MYDFRFGFSEPYETLGPHAGLRNRIRNVVRFSFVSVMNGISLGVGAFGVAFGITAGVNLARLLF